MAAEYFKNLSATQKANIATIQARMKAKGITNPLTQAAIFSVVSKESGFIPKSESSYSGTSNDRIRAIFGSRVSALNDAQLTELKKSDVNFFNKIYGGRYGNGPDEGYKYRGRGYNQITFKARYISIGKKIGRDLEHNPDLLNDPEIAADALIQYFLDEFVNGKAYLPKFNTTDINGFKTKKDSVAAIFQANAGWAKNTNANQADIEGKAHAEGRVDGFLALMGQKIDENKGTIGAGTVLLAFGIAAFAYRDQIKNFFS